MDLGPDAWAGQLDTLRRVGCRDLILQWTGVDNGSSPWVLPDALVVRLLAQCQERGMGLQIGLPYDERWWQALQSPDAQELAGFLDRTSHSAVEYIGRRRLSQHAAFRGWYIPYEIEQHSWRTPERRAQLIAWLNIICRPCLESYPVRAPAVSTYLSALSSADSLPALWREIASNVRVRPMVQDGVGVHGMANYAALAPLRQMLLEQHIEFDLVIELFEQTSAANAPFQARAAAYSRIHRQLLMAQHYGAQNIVAFAVDPWMTGNEPGARQLLRSWQAIY